MWDAHKLLMMPALVTAVLFKREAHAYEAFAQQASYLFAGTHPDETWWDLGQRTLAFQEQFASFHTLAHVDRNVGGRSDEAPLVSAADDL